MSGKTEIPGVNSAVQKLQELEDQMRTSEFPFKDNDLDNIDHVIDALFELERERKSMHDELEKETIRSSILRHQFRILPGQIRDEIMEAVMSARNSNAKVLMGLQAQLKTMTTTTDTLSTQSQDYEQENDMLQPERELLKQQHEEIISQLNQRMADKSGMQIALNETRDQVRQANQDIMDLEDRILQLKEDLIEERTAARQEKKRLIKSVADTTQRSKEQKDQNVIMKREMNGLQEKMADLEGKLDTIRKSIHRYQTSQAKLEGEESVLSTELAQQQTVNDQLRVKGAEIMNNRIEEERSFKAAEQELLNAIKQFQEDINAGTARQKKLEQRKIQVQQELSEREEQRAADKCKVEEVDGVLQAAKFELNKTAEEVGALQKETMDMSQQIVELAESHQAVLAQLKKQMEDYKEQLSKERKERLEVQTQKENFSKQLDDTRLEGQALMNEMTGIVQNGKKRHLELSNEGITLQKQLKEDEASVQNMEKQLKEVQDAYEQMFTNFQKKQDTIEADVMRLEAGLANMTKERDVQKPGFEELEEHFTRRSEEYDSVMKRTVDMKNKKSSMADQVKRLQREIEMTKSPQAQLREDTKHLRQLLVSRMQANGATTKDKEEEILDSGCRLRLVMEENHKFEEAIKQLKADLEDIQKQMVDNELIKEELAKELHKQKQELINKWKSDTTMQEFFAIRDKATAEAFGRLLKETNKRETRINTVTERMGEELTSLSDFLDNLSHRRPERSRSEQKARSDKGDSRSRSRSKSRVRSESRQSSKLRDKPKREQSQSPRRENTKVSLSSIVMVKPLVLPKIV